MNIMKQCITVICLLLLADLTHVQAQRKEPEVKACEQQIKKLLEAPDDVSFVRELQKSAYFCFNRGMYDEAALLASLTVPFNTQYKDSIGKLRLPALLQAFSLKEEDMAYSNMLDAKSLAAYARMANAYSTVGESMMHNASLRSHVEQIFKSTVTLSRLAGAKYTTARTHSLLGDFYYQEKRYADAVKSYRKSAESGEKAFLEDELEDVKNRLCMALIQHGRYKDAENVLSGITAAATPGRTVSALKDALCNRACIAITKKDYAAAETMRKEADRRYRESLRPMNFYRRNVLRNFFDSFSLVARCYEQQNEIEKAMQTYCDMKECLAQTQGRYIPY